MIRWREVYQSVDFFFRYFSSGSRFERGIVPSHHSLTYLQRQLLYTLAQYFWMAVVNHSKRNVTSWACGRDDVRPWVLRWYRWKISIQKRRHCVEDWKFFTQYKLSLWNTGVCQLADEQNALSSKDTLHIFTSSMLSPGFGVELKR